jgi:hypothetical protein
MPENIRTYEALPRTSRREQSVPATGDACRASVSCLKTASRGPLRQKSGKIAQDILG